MQMLIYNSSDSKIVFLCGDFEEILGFNFMQHTFAYVVVFYVGMVCWWNRYKFEHKTDDLCFK